MSILESVYEIYTHSSGVNTDSRTLKRGEVFFALKGENFNGNQFAKTALNEGAAAVVCDEEQDFAHHLLFVVDDSLKFLQEIANHHRHQCQAKYIAITGSNGKTTTKELMRDVLATSFKTQATQGNFNNHIGVPLTLLSIEKDTDVAIIEMGANHQKEIEALCAIAEPDYGYITNFGKAHLEGFGGVEGVIKGKSEMYTYLIQRDKKALLNYDDAIQKSRAKELKHKSFSTNGSGDFQFKNTTREFVSFKINSIEIKTQLLGDYNLSNVCAAVAFGLWFGADIHDIKEACESYVPDMNRSEIVETNKNKIILDAYNANPTSMYASIENFTKSTFQNKLMILGDMFEMGEYAKEEHQAIVELVEQSEIETFFTGEELSNCKLPSNTISFKTTNDLLEHLEANPIIDRTILIKGSRGMSLEKTKDLL